MTTTISDGTTTVTLSDDLLQEDEHGWSPVQQATTHTLTGALWVDVSVKQTGRPITLAAGADPDGTVYGITTRADYARLRAMADTPGQVCTLTWRGAAYQVLWRHEDPPALDARDLINYPDPAPEDYVLPTLKFTVIS